METSEPAHSSTEARSDLFATTRWTVVIEAGHASTPQARLALEELCGAYWYPLYAYIRRRGASREDAEDLTQAFFARFLQTRALDGLNAERGRFRAFLLASLKHFLANARDRAGRQKRGGGATHLSLDWETADTQFQIADGSAASPDREFDREWAVALLEKVFSRLMAEHAREGHAGMFARLQPFLVPHGGAASYAEAARALGMEEGAVRVAVHRLRKRYRALLRDEIAQTVSTAEAVDEEMRTLFQAFAT